MREWLSRGDRTRRRDEREAGQRTGLGLEMREWLSRGDRMRKRDERVA